MFWAVTHISGGFGKLSNKFQILGEFWMGLQRKTDVLDFINDPAPFSSWFFCFWHKLWTPRRIAGKSSRTSSEPKYRLNLSPKVIYIFCTISDFHSSWNLFCILVPQSNHSIFWTFGWKSFQYRCPKKPNGTKTAHFLPQHFFLKLVLFHLCGPGGGAQYIVLMLYFLGSPRFPGNLSILGGCFPVICCTPPPAAPPGYPAPSSCQIPSCTPTKKFLWPLGDKETVWLRILASN